MRKIIYFGNQTSVLTTQSDLVLRWPSQSQCVRTVSDVSVSPCAACTAVTNWLTSQASDRSPPTLQMWQHWLHQNSPDENEIIIHRISNGLISVYSIVLYIKPLHWDKKPELNNFLWFHRQSWLSHSHFYCCFTKCIKWLNASSFGIWLKIFLTK